MRRKAAVAGTFYQSSPARLHHETHQYLVQGEIREKVLGAVVPHAGLIYSGAVAGAVYSRIAIPETFLLVGPNHTGVGSRISLMPQGEWEIPTAVVAIDEDLANRFLSHAPMVSRDSSAHMAEHSLEVQLPFITAVAPAAKIVPLTIMSSTLEECRELGSALARAVTDVSYPVVILASSDMSHYVPDETARRKDRLAIDRILALDPEGLWSTVHREEITMCGYLPTAIMLFAARELGAREAALVKYATSAERSGDYDYVVGYAGVIVS